MSDKRRLIGQGDGTTVLQFPSSPDTSEEDERLVYQRGDRRRRKSVESNGSSGAPGKQPLVDTRLRYKQYSAIDHMPERERMDMDYNGKNSTTFSRQRGFFLDVRWAIGLFVLFIASLLLVGLLVGFLAPGKCTNCDIPVENVPDEGSTIATLTAEDAFALRLPLTVFPTAYHITLQPFINGNLTTNGSMSLIMDCRMATQNITLNVLNVNVTKESVTLESVDGNGTTAPKITDLSYDVPHQFVILHLDSFLSVDESYRLNMSFVSSINDVLAGLYKSSYKSGNETKYLAVTQFEATDARRVFPCFDEPAFKATFDISIIREPNMTAISNGPLLNTESGEDGWEIDHFLTTPKMSTYLVAIVISDFSNLTLSTEEPKFTVWSRKDVIESAKYPASIGPGIITYYNKFFNISYPMKKTDNFAIPDFNAGAMENWGLITYRETSLLFDEKLSTAYDKQYICQTMAHELAHQWFGNLVTPAWWNDLWLNEGFASYMEYVGSDIVEPAWKMMELFIIDKEQAAKSLDGMTTSHPISVEVKSPNEINDLFDGISYDKGASIIRMMHCFLGNETFLIGLQTYLRDLAYSSAVSEDLWNHLYQAQNLTNAQQIVNVSKIMNTWSKQTGYPLLTVTRNYEDYSIHLTQNIFLTDASNMTDTQKESLWDVPIAWASQETPLVNWTTSPSIWMDNRTMETAAAPKSNGWLLLNIEAAGFYRVNYDPKNWAMITSQLQNDHSKIPVITRAQILDDSFSLAQAGILPYTIPLEISRYLSNETEYVPFSAAMTNLGVIFNSFIRSEVYGLIRDYLRNLTLPTYQRLGWKDIRNESVQEQYMQSDSLSTLCSQDYPDCVQQAVKYFNEWKNNTQATMLNPNWRKLIYCVGVTHGTTLDFDFVWNRYLVESVPSEKKKLRNALTCTREMWLLSKLLQMSLENEGISQQDSPTIISQVASTDHGRELAFNYVRENWDTLYKMFGGITFSLSDIIAVVAGRLNTQAELNDYVAFKNKVFAENKEGTAKTAFTRALEVINSNIQFMNRSYEEITSWLKGRTPNQTNQIKVSTTDQNTTGVLPPTTDRPSTSVDVNNNNNNNTNVDVNNNNNNNNNTSVDVNNNNNNNNNPSVDVNNNNNNNNNDDTNNRNNSNNSNSGGNSQGSNSSSGTTLNGNNRVSGDSNSGSSGNFQSGDNNSRTDGEKLINNNNNNNNNKTVAPFQPLADEASSGTLESVGGIGQDVVGGIGSQLSGGTIGKVVDGVGSQLSGGKIGKVVDGVGSQLSGGTIGKLVDGVGSQLSGGTIGKVVDGVGSQVSGGTLG